MSLWQEKSHWNCSRSCLMWCKQHVRYYWRQSQTACLCFATFAQRLISSSGWECHIKNSVLIVWRHLLIILSLSVSLSNDTNNSSMTNYEREDLWQPEVNPETLGGAPSHTLTAVWWNIMATFPSSLFLSKRTFYTHGHPFCVYHSPIQSALKHSHLLGRYIQSNLFLLRFLICIEAQLMTNLLNQKHFKMNFQVTVSFIIYR